MSEWIVTENILLEAWNRIIEYANIDYTFAEIKKMHGAPGNQSTKKWDAQVKP